MKKSSLNPIINLRWAYIFNCMQTLAASLLLITSSAVQSASVYVQHQGEVTQGAILAFDTGPGFTLSADLLAGDFSIFADASPTVPVNNNFSGMFRPVEFTNDTGAAVTIAAGAIRASVHASFSHGPAQGGAHNTNMRTGGGLFVRVLGGAGQGDYSARFGYQVSVFYNLDGTVAFFTPEYLPNASNGASVLTGPGGGIGGANIHFAMPALLLDPGARLQLTFEISGDASDSSSTNVFNTLNFELPAGVTLNNDVGLPLAWVTNVPVPAAVWLFGAGITTLLGVVRTRKTSAGERA